MVKIVGYEKGTGKKVTIAEGVNMELALRIIDRCPHYTDPVNGKVYTTYTENY